MFFIILLFFIHQVQGLWIVDRTVDRPHEPPRRTQVRTDFGTNSRTFDRMDIPTVPYVVPSDACAEVLEVLSDAAPDLSLNGIDSEWNCLRPLDIVSDEL